MNHFHSIIEKLIYVDSFNHKALALAESKLEPISEEIAAMRLLLKEIIKSKQ